jgi:phage gp36-like protein
VSSYATPTDLARNGVPSSALDGITSADQQVALDAASGIADGYVAARYTLPLVAPFPTDLVIAVCQIAAWNLLRVRGFNPDAGQDAVIRSGYEDATRWLRLVAEGKVSPQVIDSTPSGNPTAGPFVQQGRVSSTSTDADGMPVLVVGAPVPRGW